MVTSNGPQLDTAASYAGLPDDEEYRQLTTLDGWRRYVDDEPAVPNLLDQRVWEQLDADKRFVYDEQRLAHHARLLVVATSTVRRVIAEGRRLSYLNRYAVSGRCGLILSGVARTGKTTSIAQLGKTMELLHRRRRPTAAEDIPVIYMTIPPAATPRMVAVELARFLGLPITSRANVTDVTEAVCGVCIATRTALICVDEIHNIKLTTRYGAETSDALKYFSERIPATFVYAGLDVEDAGLLSGIRGQQIAGRFSMVRTGPFPRGEEWSGLVAALEDSLRLHAHTPGTLSKLDGYLHQRTRGMIGSLLRLVRSAAIDAVLDGSERVTKASLEGIEIDVAAEGARAGNRTAR